MNRGEFDPLNNASYEIKMDDIKYYLSTVNGDMSHTYGNATANIEKHIRSKFPKKFFNSINISTQIAVKQRQKIRRLIDYKQQKPILSIQPKLNLERTEYNIDYTRRLYGTELYDLLRPDQHNVKFFKDVEKRIFVDFSVDRASMEFDTVIVVSTEYQQYNLATHILNNIRLEHPYYIPTTMEIVIPNCIIEKISIDSGIPIRDENGSVAIFLNYLNNISRIPISYKMQTSTKNHKFFLIVENDMYVLFNSLNIQEGGDRTGQISDSFDISFSVKTEFNYPNCFFFISTNQEPAKSDNDNLLSDIEGRTVIEQIYDRTIIPDRLNTKSLVSSVTFELENDGIDEINIKELLDNDTINIIELLNKEDATKIVDFIELLIYEETDIVEPNNILIDWNDYDLTIMNCSIKNVYRMIIYIDLNIMNNYKLKNHKY